MCDVFLFVDGKTCGNNGTGIPDISIGDGDGKMTATTTMAPTTAPTSAPIEVKTIIKYVVVPPSESAKTNEVTTVRPNLNPTTSPMLTTQDRNGLIVGIAKEVDNVIGTGIKGFGNIIGAGIGALTGTGSVFNPQRNPNEGLLLRFGGNFRFGMKS